MTPTCIKFISPKDLAQLCRDFADGKASSARCGTYSIKADGASTDMWRRLAALLEPKP